MHDFIIQVFVECSDIFMMRETYIWLCNTVLMEIYLLQVFIRKKAVKHQKNKFSDKKIASIIKQLG